MRYVMAFRIGTSYRIRTSDCETAEVDGQKEMFAMRLEEEHGRTVICTSVLPVWGREPRTARTEETEENDDDQ